MRRKVVDETEEKVESRSVYGTPEENAETCKRRIFCAQSREKSSILSVRGDLDTEMYKEKWHFKKTKIVKFFLKPNQEKTV